MLNSYFANFSPGINQTVGWTLSTRAWQIAMDFWMWSAFLTGYGVFALVKMPTTIIWSSFHILLLILIFIAEEFLNLKSNVELYLSMASFIIFILNVLMSTRRYNLKNTDETSMVKD